MALPQRDEAGDDCWNEVKQQRLCSRAHAEIMTGHAETRTFFHAEKGKSFAVLSGRQ
jgi:hypothetical protein